MDDTAVLLLTALLAIFAVLAFLIIYGTVAKTKWGVNLSQVKCPGCGALQAFVRTPSDARQGIWGGYTCSQCGTRMDKWGRAEAARS